MFVLVSNDDGMGDAFDDDALELDVDEDNELELGVNSLSKSISLSSFNVLAFNLFVAFKLFGLLELLFE